jgi:CRP/FNR family transcriptional regulator, cyclic AMP receptor protein
LGTRRDWHATVNENMRDIAPPGGFWGLLSAPERALLAAAGRDSVFPAGSTICVQGDPATHLFILVSGWVKVVSVTREGQQTVLALRGNGDVVGELAGEVTGYRTATIYAIDRVESVTVPHDRFYAFLDEHLSAGRAYRHMITQRWSDTAESLRAQATCTGAQRLARLLLVLARQHGVGDGHRVVIDLPLSQTELASLVSASRATVTRAFSDWRRRHLVETSQRHVTIIDVPSLRRIAAPAGR